jgi:hypothetical protein
MHRDGCVLVIYAGADSGPVATLARWVAEGAEICPGTQVSVVRAADASKELVQRSGAVVLGTGDFHGHPEPELFAFVDSGLNAAERAALMDGAVSSGFCATTGAGQHLLEGLARSTATLGAVFVGGSSKEGAPGLMGQVEQQAEGAWTWHQDAARLRAQAHDLGRRVADVAAFYPGAYDHARAKNEDEEAQGMTLYWLCFWISLALIAVLFQQR